MTTKHSCSLIAALTYLAVLAFPGSATAQSYQWNGVATVSETEIDLLTGDPIYIFSGTEAASLSIDLYGVGLGYVTGDMTVASFEISGQVFNGTFGPSGIAGSFEDSTRAGYSYGDFSSDLSTYAFADFYGSFETSVDGTDEIVESGSFSADLQSVPEPATLTLAGIGVLGVGIFMRSRRPLRSAQTKAGADQKS
jgi:PEP-CTERM motif